MLWLQRDRAVVAPHYNLQSLSELDERLEAHLDGLRVAGEAGPQRAWQEFMDHPEPGETFTAGVLTFESGDPQQIELLLATVAGRVELVRPLISAIGWLMPSDVALAMNVLQSLPDPTAIWVAIGGSAVRRQNPGSKVFARALQHENSTVRARALRAIGELGERNLIHELYIGQADTDEACRFWSTWSVAILNGDAAAIAELRADAADTPQGRHALHIAVRRGEPKLTRSWLSGLRTEPDRRIAIMAAGHFGEADALPWLIEQAQVAATARLAAEAIAFITGLDFNQRPLYGTAPAGHADGPNDDTEDDDVAPDPDSELTWPNGKVLKEWWSSHRSSFPKQTRLLLGKPITVEWLQIVLEQGSQRHRNAAALEMTAFRGGRPLLETRAPRTR